MCCWYGNTGFQGYGVSSLGIQNYKHICPKINIPKEDNWFLRIGVVTSYQKLATILLIKLFVNWYYIIKKIVKNKKIVFVNEKTIKIAMIFDMENWLWKSNLGTFWHLATTLLILKIQ